MAKRLKAGGVKPKAKTKTKEKPASSGGRGSRRASNTPSSQEATDAFEELFDLHAELGRVSGEIRKRIADEYATIAKRLDIPKKIVKHEFALEKHRRETAKREAEFDGRDRDALMKLAQIFGEDTPFGQFAARAAGNAKRDDFGGMEEGQGAGAGADKVDGGEQPGEPAEGETEE